MIDLNKVLLFGHLQSSPKVKQDTRGKSYCVGKLVNQRTWTDSDSAEKKSETNLIDFICFGSPADKLSYVQPGQKIILEGKIGQGRVEGDQSKGRPDITILVTAFQSFNEFEPMYSWHN